MIAIHAEIPAHVRPAESKCYNSITATKKRLRKLYLLYAPLLRMTAPTESDPPVEAKEGIPCSCGDGWCPCHGTAHLEREAEMLASENAYDNYHRTAKLIRRKKLSTNG